MPDERTEMEKRDMLRLSNAESNKLTRECIQMALLHLMADKELGKISVSEIVKRAGVSRTAFYNNYTAKEDVLLSLSSELLEDLNRMLLDAISEGNSLEVFRRIFQRVKNDAVHFSMAVQAGLTNKEFDAIRRFIGQQYPDMKRPVRYLSFSWYGMVRNILLDWFLNGMEESVEEMAALCANLTDDLVARIRQIDDTLIQKRP